MHILRATLAASILVGGIVMTMAEADAMPVQSFASTASQDSRIQSVFYYRYYRPYGFRRPFYRRGFYGYGYGFRRPYSWRGYGVGHYYRGPRNRVLGSHAR